jgi:hypothetical protein
MLAFVFLSTDTKENSKHTRMPQYRIENMLAIREGSSTLREEHRLKVFENRVLKRIFGPKRDEVTGSWRKLHNEELRHL